MSKTDDLIEELQQLADRANVAFAAGQHALVDELLQRAREIAKQIDPEVASIMAPKN